jgi:hypothetical protein
MLQKQNIYRHVWPILDYATETEYLPSRLTYLDYATETVSVA